MDIKKLTKILVILILVIFLLNFLADKFYWYYSIWYFDMPMHFLGGLWLGLLIIWIFLIYFPLSSTLERGWGEAIKIILFVFLIGVGFEIFEIIFNNVIAQIRFNTLDTISDVFFDLAGGTFAILYFFKKIVLTDLNKVE